MDDLIVEFLTETNESIDELDVDLVNLEQNPNDKDLLGKIFRLMHTIKGTCGFLSLPRLEKTAHHAENVLGRFRDGELEVTPEYVTLIFESIDRIKYIIAEIEQTGSEPAGDDKDLIAKLDAAYEGKAVAEAEVDESATAAEPEPEVKDTARVETSALDDDTTGIVSEEELEAAFLAAPGPEDIAAAEAASAEVEDVEEEEISAPPPPDAAPDTTAAEKTPNKGAPLTTQTLRVNVDVLENLMTMVSELVLTRNQLLQILRTNAESEFSTPLQRLNHVVSDLQEGVMKTRMQPIGNAWSKLPRIIRDLSMELNKKINLEMRGQETELDRQVLEMIKDPLTHMVRNSGDHGIEGPADRIKAGKPEVGRILLEAFHEGGHIIIKISDDGKGLALDKIKAKIIANELATAEELEAMTPQQIQQFIFKAGFSTAEKVTSVSGRGVGMDVVRTNIEKIGGSIELNSVEGKGSTFTIKIPLTLAIVSALIVEAGEERFAIPQLSVRELVMISDQGDNRIEYINQTPVFRLRERLLPLISLGEILQLNQGSVSILNEEAVKEQKAQHDAAEPQEDGNIVPFPEGGSKGLADAKNNYIVVTQVGSYEFGIIVDRVFDTEEIVVKPVSSMLKGLNLFSGNTILGDGSVIMILDPNGIAESSGAATVAEKVGQDDHITSRVPDSQKKTSLILFSAGDAAPKAVPLSLVARLENVDVKNIEYSGDQMMVQYRDTLMPLVPFSHGVTIEGHEQKPVLVFTEKNMTMGLIVDQIIDITEHKVDVQISGSKQGLLGSAIINGKATDVVDVGYYLNSVDTTWYKDHDDTPFGKEAESSSKKSILLVDDSPFFRNMLTPLLSVAGYDVTTLESPHDALQLCEDGAKFDVIISDIEMPDMDGFEFAQKVKETNSWQDIPIVALSSHATPQDIDRGKDVGFHDYVAKFDRDTLLQSLSKTLQNDKDDGKGVSAVAE